MRQTFEIPLDIPDVTIEHVATNPLGQIEITVTSTIEGTPCRQCGQMTTKFYGEDREIRLRHLPILGRQTYIRLRPKRYECLDCHGKPTTTQQLGWYTPRSSFTRAYEEQLLLSLVNSTVQDVSIKEEIGYEAIMGVIDRHLDREMNWEDFTQLDVLGMDEISLNSILKFFQFDITGMLRITSTARYFKAGVGPSRPNWRWIMCFLERLNVNTSCKAWVKRLSRS